jgi:hypothetical protein
MLKKILVPVIVLVVAGAGWGVERQGRGSYDDMFRQSLALSFSLGGGIPLGDFGDSQVGNAEAGEVGNIEIEYYFVPSFSMGFDFGGGIFEDDDDPDWTNRINNYQFFGRLTAPVEGSVRPFGKFGIGISTITYDVEDFLGLGTLNSTSDAGLSLALAGEQTGESPVWSGLTGTWVTMWLSCKKRRSRIPEQSWAMTPVTFRLISD